jgi:hypothetical protein
LRNVCAAGTACMQAPVGTAGAGEANETKITKVAASRTGALITRTDRSLRPGDLGILFLEEWINARIASQIGIKHPSLPPR